MTYRLRCPTENVVPTFLPSSLPHEKALMRHYTPGARGIALLVTGSTVTESRNPTTDEMAAADYTYLGGRDHYITDAEAATLTAAGYGAYLTAI